MYDRFDLEQAILAAWSTKEDVDLVLERVMEDDSITTDDVANALLGISTLHEMRMQKAFAIFEQLIAEGKIK